MSELLSSALAPLIVAALLFVWLFWPIIVLWLIYRFTHDLRRIASALERMEHREVHALHPAPLPTSDSPLEIVAGRPVANSMFGR